MESLLDARAVAEVLGVRRATIYTWVSQRKVPFQKVGGALRFSPEALKDWLAAQAWAPGSEDVSE
jgi:excisionase family DNA binding protein